MGLWGAMTGRMRVKKSNLDALFLVPSAAITLETAAGIKPTGVGSVCFRAATGAAFAQTQADVLDLINADPQAPDVSVSRDRFGFTWLVVQQDPRENGDPDMGAPDMGAPDMGAPDMGAPDMGALCTDLHAVNTALEMQGFDAGLLCSLVTFRDPAGTAVGLVYLYKQGTFYPFVPVPGNQERRDNLLELQVRDYLAAELPMERDLQRWMAVWGAPGLAEGLP
ncbi:MAG: PspA-associated protein PspAB [Nocardioides sp.]